MDDNKKENPEDDSDVKDANGKTGDFFTFPYIHSIHEHMLLKKNV